MGQSSESLPDSTVGDGCYDDSMSAGHLVLRAGCLHAFVWNI